MIYVIASFKIKPESMSALAAAAKPCIEATRAEEGCISYDLHQSVTDESAIVFVERWTSREALEAHFGQPHLVTWREIAGPLFLERKIEIIESASIETL